MTLTGGSAPHEGNVLVGGVPVCDDYWGDTNAGVVCRMLGYAGGVGVTGSYFGRQGAVFVMDDVMCAGSEDSILDCAHHGHHNCGAGEAAGVICNQASLANTGTTTGETPSLQPS